MSGLTRYDSIGLHLNYFGFKYFILLYFAFVAATFYSILTIEVLSWRLKDGLDDENRQV